MQPKLVKTEQAHYAVNEWAGENESGIEPLDDAVLILPDKAVEKTKGGIFMPEDLTERQSMAAETGIIAALGDGAFVWNGDRTKPFAGKRPSTGTRVDFVRYSGQVVIGRDGKTYRSMRDTCVIGRRLA